MRDGNLDVEAARWTQDQDEPPSYVLVVAVSWTSALVILAVWWLLR